MEKAPVRIGDLEARYTSRGNLSSYSVQVWHDGLNEHREIRSSDSSVLHSKVEAVLAKWKDKWAAHQAKASRHASSASALTDTNEAQAALLECEQLLQATLNVDDRVDWQSLKKHEPFSWQSEASALLRYRARDNYPAGIAAVEKPNLPAMADFAPKPKWYHAIFSGARIRLENESNNRFAAAIAEYDKRFAAAKAEERSRDKLLLQEQKSFSEAEASYTQSCRTSDDAIDALCNGLLKKEVPSVLEHSELVLTNSIYPSWVKSDFTVGYQPEGGMLVVDFRLPAPDEVPSVEKVSFVQSKNERTVKHITDAKKKKLFDSVCYQIALRTLHELFEADDANVLEAITFNGWVEAVNPATGIQERGCIMSVQAVKAEFLAFDLRRVDPRACFKALNGVAASTLAGLAPVRPMLKLDYSDSRFVASQDVASQLDDTVNVASMNWEEFEHLVRQLFSKIFSSPGSEVRVTQASRDGGVDAIALDPDPIKGGKIVIQAKRYTGTVTVSAVRDLYGTLMNEGANRGILVTTSSFGPDAYNFAKGKPITLINGSQLLSLLAEHGHAAKIDLAAARLELKAAREDQISR